MSRDLLCIKQSCTHQNMTNYELETDNANSAQGIPRYNANVHRDYSRPDGEARGEEGDRQSLFLKGDYLP